MPAIPTQLSPIETGPETQFSVCTGKNTSSLTVRPGLSPSQLDTFRSTVTELVSEGVIPEQEQPINIIGVSEGVGESSRRSTVLIFPNFKHDNDADGEWHSVHAENAATIISSMVDLDQI